MKKLRKTQNKLRLMQSELIVEEAVRDRSLKVSSASFMIALHEL